MGKFRRVQAGAWFLTLTAIVFSVPEHLIAACLTPPGDTNGDGAANVLDVQCNILMNLWSLNGQTGPVPQCLGNHPTPTLVPDHNCDNVINISDTVLSVTFALLAPLNGDIDGNINQCVDTCESDLDGDGDFDFLDCAPLNPNVFKGAPELCNGYDDNCNGTADEPSLPSVAESCNDNNACTGTETCTPVPIGTGIFITELQIAPGGGLASQGEWVEIFNGGAAAINVRGFKLIDDGGETHTIDPGGALFIAPGGTLVFAANSDIALNGGVRANYQYANFTLDNTTDEVVLLNAQGVELDRVAYDSGAGWPILTDQSMALVDQFADNNAPGVWAPSTTGYGSNGLKGTPSGPNHDVYPGYCEDGDPVDCSGVENACNGSSCDPADGSCSPVPENDGQDCDDGNLCTQSDVCEAGECVGSNPVDCGPAALCYNAPVCDPDSGDCEATPLDNGTPCSDAIGCTTADVCADGTCLGTPVHAACDDGIFCTLDLCVPGAADANENGCVIDPLGKFGAECDDNNVCTYPDVCDFDGTCAPGFGVTCNDNNPCTDDSCDPTDGCQYAPNTAGCNDGVGCTVGDVCGGGVCTGTPDHKACEDGEFCTQNLCEPGAGDADDQGCVLDPFAMFGTPCDDGSECTYPDVCDFDGTCAPGFGVTCNDNNPCTDDSCDPTDGCVFAPNTAACDDGIDCTEDDSCTAGACVGAPSDAYCDDGEFCTINTCDAEHTDADTSGCVTDPFGMFGTPCDDGSECTYPDVCDFDGTCAPGFGVTCNDNNGCTDDSCDPSEGCVYAPNTELCDDNDACTLDDQCSGGDCVGGDAPNCDDDNPCTDDACNSDTGCINEDNTELCDDNDACTLDDQCSGGSCIGGDAPNCDDDNPCTDDWCDSDSGCMNDPNTELCDDNDACTLDDQCSGGACVGGDAPNCDDDNPCTDDGCNSDTGCTNEDNTELCDDNDACTLDDQCSGGSCIGGAAPDCNDDNPCTDDWCDSDSGCMNDPNTELCDDNDACTLDDQCSAGNCIGGDAPDCDDNNPCTDDGCDSDTGCTNEDNTDLCDDNDACTMDDQCSGGSCIGGDAPDCNDDNPCTDDWCDTDSGCMNDPNTELCDDNDACTLDDQCSGGSCIGGDAPDCNDDNPCTDDGCNSDTGCTNEDNTELCDDNDACTLDDQCSGGNCIGGDAPDCNDDNPCTDDWCDTDSGCMNDPNTELCDDNDACTLDDQCSGGSCIGGDAPDCDDDNPCTDDWCDSDAGCMNDDNVDACDDGIGCTEDDTCTAGQCVGTPSDDACDDGILCTLNTCDWEHPDADDQGCVTDGLAMFGTPCDDGSVCTYPDVCDFDGNCEPGFGVTCNDQNPCTDDVCDPTEGCLFAANTNVCDDGIICTIDDTCTDGACVGTPSHESCEDDIFCTLNTCDAENPDADTQGCVTDGLAMFGTPCDDGSECTYPDVCDFDGNCEPGFGVTCNDQNPCTDDVCDPIDGCLFAANTNACDDGIICTVDDLCADGACVGAPSHEACEDGIFCTLNTCDAENPDSDDQGCVTDGLAMFGTPCDDGSECTYPDVCDFGGNCEPGFGVTCNDQNPCTDDFCDPTDGCIYAPNTETCDDGIGCTVNDVCDAGACIGETDDSACDDGNVCTLNTCDSEHPDADDQGCVTDYFAMFGQLCDDGNGCTFPDVCDFDGNCTPGFGVECDDGAACTADFCDEESGECVYVPGDCPDDGQPCTVDVCDPTHAAANADGCVADPLPLFGSLCDDGNLCTWPDACDFDGNCAPGFDLDCDDGNDATLDSCDPDTGECIHIPVDCDDSDLCTTDEFDPISVSCVFTPIDCNDGEFCTADSCDQTHPLADAAGCVYDPFAMFGALCDDNNGCTWPDVCDLDGTCASGFPVECDDGFSCTLDVCDLDSGECVYLAGDCDDGQACTTDSCDPTHPLANADGCVFDPIPQFGNLCDDGNACTWPDVCDLDGGCASGFDIECDDGDICTVDFCDPVDGCVTEPDPAPCDDGVECTIDDTCSNGACQGTPSAEACDDGNVCSLDICDPTSGDANGQGCVYDTLSMFASPCDDGNACTEPDLCDFFGGCEPGFDVFCDDGNFCTTDFCDPTSGCTSSGLTLDENFESGAPGWTTGILSGGANGWTLTNVSGGTDPVDFGSITFGTPNDGDLLGYELSYLQSPVFSATGGGTLSFDTYSSNEFNDPYDAEQVEISYDGGNNWEILIPSSDPNWTAFHQQWFTFVVDIPAASGTPQTVLRFVYDTVDSCCGFQNITGWFIDNVTVESAGGAGSGICDDGDLCTLDVCDPILGACVYTPTECNDGEICTLDECDPGSGLCEFTFNDCDDGEFCTLDYCDPFDFQAGPDGCVHDGLSMFAQTCDDGNPCTEPDLCDFFGLCEPGFGVICNDNNPCTLDSCNPDTGECEFAATSGSCNDGVACTINDACVSGSCVGTSSNAACEDGNPCTTNLCNGAAGCTIAPTTTWYVDVTKAGLPQNGTSWATAFATVQAAVDAAQTGDAVWVRTGTYKPASAGANVVVMKQCVDLYGGFAGNENTLAARPMLPTFLNGDFDNSNSATPADSIHVVTAATNTRIDGFTVTRGNSTGQGGCIYGAGTNNVTVDNCTITQCVAAFSGGGIYLSGQPIVIEDSLISLNTAGPTVGADGGGAYIGSINVTVQRATFAQNHADHQGGGLYLATSTGIVRDCDFEANTVFQSVGQVAGGGAIWVQQGGMAIHNSEFINNQCLPGGGGWGGAVLIFGVNTPIVNCTFAENTAAGPGHAIALFSGAAPVISNSVLYTTVAGAQLGNGGGGSPVIQHSCLSGGWGGAGIGNADLTVPASNPFTIGPQGQHYLKHLGLGGATFTSACVNLGNNAIATGAGIPWQAMTTRLDGVVDASPVDAGRHY